MESGCSIGSVGPPIEAMGSLWHPRTKVPSGSPQERDLITLRVGDGSRGTRFDIQIPEDSALSFSALPVGRDLTALYSIADFPDNT